MSDLLNVSDVVALGTIINACGVRKVRWLDEDTNDLREGVSRSLVRTEDPGSPFLSGEDDMRDGFLRITTWTGEITMPVRKVMEMVKTGHFVVEDEA